MKILVTGGAGFIGSHLVERLLREGHEVIAYDNFNKYYSGKENNIRGFEKNPKCTLIRGDILSSESLESVVRGCDAIFHEAAQAGVRYSIDHPVEVAKINVVGTLNVLEAARKLNIRKVIFASSSSIYGAAQGKPMKEDQPKRPESPYAVSKLTAEMYCEVYSKLYGIQIPMLRYFTVYGPRQRPDMGIRTFVDKMLRGEAPIIFGDGTQSRDFTFVSDIVDANLLALKKNIKGCEAYNIAGGSAVTVNQLIAELNRVLSTKIKPVYAEKKAGDVADTMADISKARKEFKYSPKVGISEGLAKMAEWCRTLG